MAISRRACPSIPEGNPPQDHKGVWRALLVLWKYVLDGYSGLPAPHASTHKPQTGSDPLATATPANPTGTVALQGTADTFLRSDATIKQGIVTTKGDILGFSTTPARIPVGANGQALVADSTAALGVSYQPTPGDSYARLFMLGGF